MRVQFPPGAILYSVIRRPCYNGGMSKKPHNPTPNGVKGNPVSLAPLSPDEALRGLLRVKPADVKRLEENERTAKRSAKKPK